MKLLINRLYESTIKGGIYTMAKPRKTPYEGVHHIILKGIDRSNVFNDSSDKDYFLSVIERYSEKLSIPVTSYSLMDNHIHMTVRLNGEYPLGEFVKRVCISYVEHYFNKRYDREGALFQAKFYSRPIKDDSDYATVMRYILLNPLNGGLSKKISYRYSSYESTLRYYEKHKGNGSYAFDDILGIIPSKKEFIRFVSEKDITFSEEAFCIKDSDIKAELSKVLYENGSYVNIKSVEHSVLKEIFIRMMEKRVSVARLSRITGLSRYSIRAFCA